MNERPTLILQLKLLAAEKGWRVSLSRGSLKVAQGVLSAAAAVRLRALRSAPAADAAERQRRRSELLEVLDQAGIGVALKDQLRWDPRARIQVISTSLGLAEVPWELLAEGPRKAPVVRFLSRQHRVSRAPLELPIRVLSVELTGADESAEERFDPRHALAEIFGRHQEVFHTTLVGGAASHFIRPLLRSERWDILHLAGRMVRTAKGGGALLASGDQEPITAGELARLVTWSGTRLALLHLPSELGEGEAEGLLIELAHRVRALGGPTVLATHFPSRTTAAKAFYHRVFEGLVYDEPLDELAENARAALQEAFPADPSWSQPILLLGPGGESVLRLSDLRDQAVAAADETGIRLEDLKERLQVAAEAVEQSARPGESDLLSAVRKDLQVHEQKLHQVHEQLQSGSGLLKEAVFQQESTGRLPLSAGLLQTAGAKANLERELTHLNDLAEVVTEEAGLAARVVNSSFRDRDRALRSDESLVAGRRYEYRLHVGPKSPESHLEQAAGIPEKTLEPFYDGDQLTLRILLWSDDFVLGRDSASISLPRVGPSEEAVFPVQALARAGEARLRASLYFRQNLIQSLLVTATITGEPAEKLPAGNRARVEYALSRGFLDLRRLPERTVSILTNHDREGRPAFKIVGSEFRAPALPDPLKLRAALDAARGKLLKVGFELDRAGNPKRYLFDKHNRGSSEKLVSDLLSLAEIGWDLFDSLLPDKTVDYEDALRKVLGRRALIQVATTEAAGYVFPWALVYDQRLVVDPNNRVCPDFLADLEAGGGKVLLRGQRCFSLGCRHAEDPHTVCASGFWGFKHLIEQPPSRAEAGESKGVDDGGQLPTREGSPRAFDAELPLDLVVNGDAVFLMAVHQQLDRSQTHRKQLKKLAGLAVSVRDNKRAIGQSLRQPAPHLVYFYCHGNRTETKPYLRVGNEEWLYPADLRGWRIFWQDTRPLVFINGCHTAGLTPDQLLDFVGAFTARNAAGVIGTEVSIHEDLAREVATDFFSGLLAHRRLGEVLLEQRLRLLGKYNSMGLVYTPYCSSDLRLWVRRRPQVEVLMLEARRSPGDRDGSIEASELERVWGEAGLRIQILSNDPRYRRSGALASQDYLDALRGTWSRVIHLAMHGDGPSLVARWSEEADPERRRPVDRLTASDLRRLPLSGAIVVSGACCEGREALVQAVLGAGARAYVAPQTEVPWDLLVPFFAAFYRALAVGETLAAALTRARQQAPEAGEAYQLFGDDDAVLERVATPG